MGRKYRLVGPNIETEIIDVVTGNSLEDLTEENDGSGLSEAEVQALIDASAGGGLQGSKTLVVSTVGNNTAAALDPYGTEFLTIQAAVTAATAGDLVIVRPGTYANPVVLKNGVNIFALPGVTIKPATAGGTLFSDAGVAVTCMIDGCADFASGQAGDEFCSLTGASSLVIRGRSVAFTHNTCYGLRALAPGISIDLDIMEGISCKAAVLLNTEDCTVRIRARTIASVSGYIVAIAGASTNMITVEATDSIIGATVLLDQISNGATRVTIKAPRVVATDSGDYTFKVNNTGTGAKYYLDADEAVLCVNARAVNGEVSLRVGTLLPVANNINPVSAGGGRLYIKADEVRALPGGGACNPLRVQQTADVHVMSGRIVAADGGADGDAITFAADTALVTVYPGVILVAGNHASTHAVGIAGLAATPTVTLMGVIAANKAADGAVVVAVGSLLVDVLVV